MTLHTYFPAILVGCVLLVSAGFASADNVDCVDKARCIDGAKVVRASDLKKPSPQRAKVSPEAQTYAAARKAREAAWANRPVSNHRLPHDAATVAAARSILLLRDTESSALRRENVAALDLKDQPWFKF
jgi:hypothetical protein